MRGLNKFLLSAIFAIGAVHTVLLIADVLVDQHAKAVTLQELEDLEGPVPQAVKTLVEARCIPFLKVRPDQTARLNAAGLVQMETPDGDPAYRTQNHKVVLEAFVYESGTWSCRISDLEVPWTGAERAEIEKYAAGLGPAWAGKPFQQLDMRGKTGFPLHDLYRPVDDEGQFLTVVTTPIAGDRNFTMLTLGYGIFDTGDADV